MDTGDWVVTACTLGMVVAVILSIWLDKPQPREETPEPQEGATTDAPPADATQNQGDGGGSAS